MKLKLSNCPFCGGEAEIVDDERAFTNGVFIVRCKSCKSQTTTGTLKTKLAELWNKRKGGE